MQSFLPASANLYVVLSVFIFFLVIFHLILVRWIKLSSKAWKKVDYVWLGFAALGLFAAVEQVRVLYATNQIDMFQDRATSSLNFTKDIVRQLASTPGAVCRTFVRSEVSPPQQEFERLQQEYNQVCDWLQGLEQKLPSEVSTPPISINPDVFSPLPNLSDSVLKQTIDIFFKQIDNYNQAAEELRQVYIATQRTTRDLILVFFGPFLLAFAIALRITKVTGEINLQT